MYDEGVQDQAQWTQNVEVYMLGLPKPVSEAALHFKQWWHFKLLCISEQPEMQGSRYLRLLRYLLHFKQWWQENFFYEHDDGTSKHVLKMKVMCSS